LFQKITYNYTYISIFVNLFKLPKIKLNTYAVVKKVLDQDIFLFSRHKKRKVLTYEKVGVLWIPEDLPADLTTASRI